MTRIICALLLALLTTLSAVAIARAYPVQPVGVCYAVSASGVETTYINVPGSGAYPVFSEGLVTETDRGFESVHRTVFERRGGRVFLPGVMR